MKSLLIITALMACLNLTNCASSGAEQKAQLTSLANLAITAAEIGGVINPTQAALVRKGGVLVLDRAETMDAANAAGLAMWGER